MKLEDIKKIAVLGAGTMGPGIAQAYAGGGYEVAIYTRREETLEKAKVMLKSNIRTFVEQGLYTEEEAAAVENRVSFVRTVEEAVKDAQFVQETVAEKPDVKAAIFQQLDELLPRDVIIVSNASSLDPFKFIPEHRQACFSTAHWYAPPHILPLVEVAKNENTDEETMETVMGLLKKCGKTPVRMEKYVPGYIINRIQILLHTEIFYLLNSGVCTPEMLDLAAKASFIPRAMVLGLVQRYDFTGLDITASNVTNASYVMPDLQEHAAILFDHVNKGELGVKTGKGFFDYEGRSTVELSKLRDERLFEVFKATGHLIDKRI